MNPYLSILFELVAGLIFLFILIQLLGKTQFSQLTPFDFISSLILGELVGNAIYDDNIKLYHIAFAIFIWGLLIFSLEMITRRFNRTRKFLEGEPHIVIQNGKIRYLVLKKIKLDINQLQSLIRQQGYFSLQEVAFAVMETNGSLSILPNSEYDIPKRSDLNLLSKPVELPVTLMMEGEVINGSLKEAGVNEKWLKDQLAKQNISNYKDVLYAEWTSNNNLYVNKY